MFFACLQVQRLKTLSGSWGNALLKAALGFLTEES